MPVRLSKSKELRESTSELPSPLAVPLASVFPRLDEGDHLGAFLAGMDAFLAALKWTTFVAIADIFQKLEEDHPFVKRETLKSIFPYICRVLEPKQSHGHWIACVRQIIRAYGSHPDWFFIPELLAAQKKSEEDPLRFEEKLDRLVRVRNKYAHGGDSRPDPGEARKLWNEIDPLLGMLYAQLSVMKDYRLVQFKSMLEHQEGGWLRCERVTLLRGYRMNEQDLTAGPIRAYFGDKPPRMRQLYLFDETYKRHLCLHPFVLFSVDVGTGLSGAGSTFLFNELQEKALVYNSLADSQALRWDLRAKDDDDSIGEIAGPIYQHFVALKTVTAESDVDRLSALPGFPRRSRVLSFKRVIAFHTEGFTGRREYFEQVDHALSGPFHFVWVKGLAGYGKTAFIAMLAQQHPGAITYFVSPEKGTADASTFLLHMCQSLTNRFNFPDVITDDQAADVGQLKALFDQLLARAGKEFAGSQISC